MGICINTVCTENETSTTGDLLLDFRRDYDDRGDGRHPHSSLHNGTWSRGDGFRRGVSGDQFVVIGHAGGNPRGAISVQGDRTGCPAGNREKLSSI